MHRAWDEMVAVGRVARAHGNRGAVVVNPETDFPATRFREGRVVHVRRGEVVAALTVATVRFQDGRPIVAFREIATMTDAEALAGLELRVPEVELETLPEHAYYRHALVGCRVLTSSGVLVGAVVAVEGERDGSRLVIGTPTGEVLVPLAEEICRRVDPEAGEIVIEPPEGLLDLNR